MTAARRIHSDEIVAGAGEVKLALRLDNGKYDGERYVGDSASLSLAMTRNVIDVQSGDGATPRTIREIVTSTERTFSLTLNDTSIDNLALFFQADIGEQDNANTAVADEHLEVYPGRWYQLGQSATNPMGWGALYLEDDGLESNGRVKDGKALAITKSDDNGLTASGGLVVSTRPADVFGADPEADVDVFADLKRGAIYISPHGELNGEGPHDIYVDYKPAEPATKRKTFQSTTKAQNGALRYVEQGVDGEPGQDIYARLCSVTANGELNFKDRNAARQIALSLKVLKPDDGYPAIAGIQSMGSESYDD